MQKMIVGILHKCMMERWSVLIFVFLWTIRKAIAQSCGASLYNSGSFNYPSNYPGNYPDFAECRWTINTPPGTLVQVQFNEPFGIPGRDFLAVVDGKYANRLGSACSLKDYFDLGPQGQAFILIRADRADFPVFTSTTNSVIAVFCAQGQRGSRIPRIGFRGYFFAVTDPSNPLPQFRPPSPIFVFPTPAPPVWTPAPPAWTPAPFFPPTRAPFVPPTFAPPATARPTTPFPWTPPPPATPFWVAPIPPSTSFPFWIPPATAAAPATCGNPIRPPAAGRIIGGNPAIFGSWPYMVAVVDTRYNGQFCGGVLIDAFWVLTAAHCVVDKPAQFLILRIGATDFNASVGDPRRGVDYKAAFLIVQPSYDSTSFVNDMAMIRLSSQVQFSDSIKPICLPSGPPADGVVCYIAGYGLTTAMRRKKRQVNIIASGSSTLMETDIPIVPQTTCQTFFDLAFPGLIKLTNSHVCAGSIYPVAHDSCSGDSGGPLVCRRSNRYEIVGVTSFGVGCGRTNVFGAYTNVWQLLPWINSIRGLQSN